MLDILRTNDEKHKKIIDDLKKKGTDILQALKTNPPQFVKNLYEKGKVGTIPSRQTTLSSAYGILNNVDLCCALGEGKSEICHNALFTDIDARTYKLHLGDIVQREYQIKIYPIKNFHISIANIDTAVFTREANQNCSSNKPSSQYIGSDKFTNAYLIGLILTQIYEAKKNSLGGVQKLLGATICMANNKGILLMEDVNENFGNFIVSPLYNNFKIWKGFTQLVGGHREDWLIRPNVIFSIVKQVIANLEFLKAEATFQHGNLTVENLLVNIPKFPSIQSIRTVDFKGLKWYSYMEIKLTNFDYASIDYQISPNNSVRLFKSSSSLVGKFLPAYSSKVTGTSPDLYYQLDSNFVKTLMYKIRYTGFPYYYDFDIYTFMVSLSLIPQIYYMVNDDTSLKQLWNLLWHPDEISKANNLIANAMYKGDHSYAAVTDILNNLKLKCKVSDKLITYLKTRNVTD